MASRKTPNKGGNASGWVYGSKRAASSSSSLLHGIDDDDQLDALAARVNTALEGPTEHSEEDDEDADEEGDSEDIGKNGNEDTVYSPDRQRVRRDQPTGPPLSVTGPLSVMDRIRQGWH